MLNTKYNIITTFQKSASLVRVCWMPIPGLQTHYVTQLASVLTWDKGKTCLCQAGLDEHIWNIFLTAN